MQIPLIQPESDWIAPQVLPKFDPHETLAVDLETYDPNLINRGPGWATGDGYVVGIAIASDSWSGYLPIRHENGGNLEEEVLFLLHIRRRRRIERWRNPGQRF